MNLFHLQLLISFFAGGFLIALQTFLGERFSGVLRGIVLTVPTTMAAGLFFIGLAKSSQDVVDVARMIPSYLTASYFFVMTFAFLSRFGLLIGFFGSFVSFASIASFIFLYPPSTFFSSIFLYSLPLTFLFYLPLKKLPKNFTFKKYPINVFHILVRAFIGGSLVLLMTYLSKTFGNVWGAIFSIFPAGFSSTFLIYYYLQGEKSIPVVAQSLFFPGVFGFILYALIAAISFPFFGIWLGTLICYAAVFLFFWIYFLFSRKIPQTTWK